MLSRLLPLLFLLAISAAMATAQSGSSSISGTITDTTGASAPGAQVTLVNNATGARLTQVTTDAGLFAFPAIPVGTYTLTVELKGFKVTRRENIVLQVGSPITVDIALEVGETTDTISVSASTELVQTSNAALGGTVEQKAIANLPLNGRNPLALIVTEPGVMQRSGNTIVVNGARSAANNVTIDGIEANESSNPNATNNVFRLTPDSVQEFKVTTANATAEEGRNSGASVNIATRSGSNDVHGRLFYFLRNTALNADEFYAKALGTQKPDIKLNQYGFDIGGPVIKNRFFLFGSWQGQQINYSQSVDQTFGETVDLYTPLARNGAYRYFVADPRNPFILEGQRITQNTTLLVNPATGALRPEVRTCGSPTDANCVATYNVFQNDPRGIGPDKTVFGVLGGYPFPNSYSAGDGLNTGIYVWNPPIQVRGPQYLIRGDFIFNDHHSMFARYLAGDNRSLNGDPLNGRPVVIPGYPPRGEVFRPAKNAALGFRSMFTPRIVNEFTAGFARFDFNFTRGEANPLFPDTPPFTFNNSDVDYTNAPRTARVLNTFQVLDNLSVVAGAHQLRFGGNIRFYQHNDIRGELGAGNVTPATSLSRTLRAPGAAFNLPALGTATVPGIASNDLNRLQGTVNDLLGIPARLQQIFLGDLQSDAFLPYITGDNQVTMWSQGQRLKQYNLYAQDEWKLRRNLTLNIGIRWEINPAPSEAAGRTWVPDRMIDGSQGMVTFVPKDRWFQNNNLGAFAPRVSLAWSPGVNGRTAVRAGFGTAFDTISSFQVTSVAIRVPGQQFTCSSTPGGTTTPGCQVVPDLRLAEGFPSVMNPPTVKPSSFLTPPIQTYGNAPAVTVFDQGLKIPTVYMWNLNIQREIANGLVVQAGYVGRRGTRLYRSYDINQINAKPLLPSFLAMQGNVVKGCNPDGTGCPAGATPLPVPIVQQGIVNGAFVNTSATRTDLSQNAAGNFVTRVEQQTNAGKYRPNQQFNRITYIDNGGDSNYNSLQLSLRKRFDAGLLLNANYTFGKSIDNQSLDPVGSTAAGGLGTTAVRTPVDSFNFALERARSDFDRRQVLNITGVYELPFGRGKKFAGSASGFANQLIGGWSISGYGTFMTGEPFSIRSGVLTANGSAQSRADVIPGANPVARLQEKQGVIGPVMFQNAGAFAIPAPGATGMGRNVFTGSAFQNTDLALSKMFFVNEKINVTFRAEMFNAMNHPNFENPRDATSGNPNILSPVFAQTCCTTMSTTTAANVLPQGESWRVLQLALRVQF